MGLRYPGSSCSITSSHCCHRDPDVTAYCHSPADCDPDVTAYCHSPADCNPKASSYCYPPADATSLTQR